FKPYDGGFIVAGCSDGSLQLFNERKRYGKADMIARTAHTDVVTSVNVLEDGQRMLSRSLDGKAVSSATSRLAWGTLAYN
ncbi:WD repeat-containing protein 70, partial [Perkinsus olseni]